MSHQGIVDSTLRVLNLTRSVRLTSSRDSLVRRQVRATLLLVLLSLLAGAAVAQASGDPKVPPREQRAYRVCVSVAFADAPQWTGDARRRVVAEAAGCVSRWVGEAWDVRVVEDRRLIPVTRGALERLGAGDVALRAEARDCDKVFVAAVLEDAVAVREWDAILGAWGPVREASVRDERETADQVVRLATEIFRPWATLEQGHGEIALLAFGGEIPPADPELRPLQTGEAWMPVFRISDPKTETTKLQPVPWTFLQVGDYDPDRDRARALTLLATGLRAPLTERRRPRIEALAIAARPLFAATHVQFVTRTSAAEPQIGLEVDVGTKTAPTARLLTDRHGQVRLTPTAEPLTWLTVHSGQNVLARLPYVPGFRPFESCDLPDDSVRLRVEGDLSLMQARLLEVVIRRAVLIAQTRRAARAGDWDGSAVFRKSIHELPGPTTFTAELSNIRVQALNEAKEKRDAATAARVEKACRETSDLIAHYLDADKLKQLDEELADLKADKELAEQPPVEAPKPKPAPPPPKPEPPKPEPPKPEPVAF